MKRRTLHVAGSYAPILGLLASIGVLAVAVGVIIEAACDCIASEMQG